MEDGPEYKLLVVEDEATLREMLQDHLARQGYQVSTAADGREAVETARRERPDLILLAVRLPGPDGFEVCRILRQETNVPVLMLATEPDEVDKVVGFEVGADDYITKPFSMRELLARIKAALRRERLVREEVAAQMGPPSSGARRIALTFGDMTLDLGRGEVRRGGEPLHLKPKEYQLLVFFARNCGMVLSRDLIMQRVWGWDYVGASRSVDVHVRWLREKIEPDPGKPQRIVTVRGMGYRFEG